MTSRLLEPLGQGLSLMLIASICASCATSGTGPPPPDTTSALAQIDALSTRMERIEEVITRDTTYIEEIERSFFGVPPSSWAPPFPLDAFRLVAMSCFHESVAHEHIDAPPTRETSVKMGLVCQPSTLDDLSRRLDRLPSTYRTFAASQLLLVDRARIVRARLEFRIGRLEVIVEDAREKLARAGAAQRALRRQFEQRRAEFDDDAPSLEETRLRLATYRERIDHAESRIESLLRQAPQWEEKVRTFGSDFTYALAWIGLDTPPSSGTREDASLTEKGGE